MSTTMETKNSYPHSWSYSFLKNQDHEGYRNTIGASPVGNNEIKLATGLNDFQQDPSPHGRILLLISCLILSTGKDRKTPQRYPDVPTTSWRISI
ncbi:hypothetical protein Tco_1082669 [Tanacetum coccineum]|uniref:Uncharacterized protein n=1 Tax=Tanacetum coccineum TaxID=301880 RepID=A0ABQ5I2B9_9ASTR